MGAGASDPSPRPQGAPATGTPPRWSAARLRTPLAGAVAVGILAGFLSGLFGVGGGILIVPGLVFVLDMEQHRAHGTSLAAIFPIAISGVTGFALDGGVDWTAAAFLVAGSLGGTVIGTAALRRIAPGPLRLLFAGVLFAAAIRMLTDIPEGAGRGDLDVAMVAGLVGVGLVAGVAAGLLGVGGGIVMVPGQTIFFSISDVVAKGTSLAVIVPASLLGTYRNVRFGNADVRVAMAVGLSGVVSAFLASKLSFRMSPTLSSVLFALLLVVAGTRMVVRHFRPAKVAEPPEEEIDPDQPPVVEP